MSIYPGFACDWHCSLYSVLAREIRVSIYMCVCMYACAATLEWHGHDNRHPIPSQYTNKGLTCRCAFDSCWTLHRVSQLPNCLMCDPTEESLLNLPHTGGRSDHCVIAVIKNVPKRPCWNMAVGNVGQGGAIFYQTQKCKSLKITTYKRLIAQWIFEITDKLMC